jgi:4-hydroxy-2-oxoglutarate aldolase
MTQIDLNGIFPPITTPFIDDNVVYDKLASNIEKWGQTGLRGFVVLGSNGEYVSLSEEEKRKVVETVVQAAPEHMSIIAGTGCESTRETIRLTADCAALGAHAALVVTPHYFGGKMTEAALVKHYTAVADSSPIPLILYNVPKFTHVNLTVNIVARLAQHANIIGIKDSTGNVIQLGEYLNRVDTNFSVLVGTAGALYGGLTLGCAGGVWLLPTWPPQNVSGSMNSFRMAIIKPPGKFS